MQLDQTHVAIRVRTLSEIGDLSLLMIRRYPHAFFHAFFVGAAFWIIADLLLLGWLPSWFTNQGLFDDEGDVERGRYVFWMMTLVFLQTPIAGVLTTYMLGQAIFEKQPTLRSAVREVRSMFWPLLWTLGVKRLAIPAMIVVAMQWKQDAHVFFDFVMPISFILVAALIRSNRPFIPEMILLERCPIRSKDANAITLKRRSKALHSPMASDLGGRFLTVSLTLTALLACVFFALVWTRGIALGDWSADMFAMLVFFPLSLWLIASLSVVVRLLGYLDARIRLEGWEVELAIRAEAYRQFGEDFMGAPARPVPNRATGMKQPAVSETSATDSSDSKAVPETVAPPPNSTPTAPVSESSASNVSSPPGVLVWLLFVLSVANGVFFSASATASSSDFHFVAAAETPVVVDSAWFDAEEGKIRPIELSDTRDDTDNRDSRWLVKPAKPKPRPATPTKPAVANGSWWNGLSFVNLLGWLLLMCLIGALVGLLMYVFANSSFDFRPDALSQSVVHARTLDEQTKQRIAELPAELRDTSVNPRSELERLMDAGDFDRAIIFLYGHQLLMLDRAGCLRLSRWKTNKQYVRESKQSHVRIGDQLNETVDAFERSYFGKHSLSREQFEGLWQNNLQIEQALSGKGAAS